MAVRESVIKGNKQNSSANMPQNIKQDKLNNENQSLVFEKDSSSFNEPILANDSYTKVILEKEADLDMDGDSDVISVAKPKEQDDRTLILKFSYIERSTGKVICGNITF